MAEPGAGPGGVDSGSKVDTAPRADSPSPTGAPESPKAFDASAVKKLLSAPDMTPESGLKAIASGAAREPAAQTLPTPDNLLTINAPTPDGEVTVNEPKSASDATPNTDKPGEQPAAADQKGRFGRITDAVKNRFAYKPLNTPQIDNLDLRRPAENTTNQGEQTAPAQQPESTSQPAAEQSDTTPAGEQKAVGQEPQQNSTEAQTQASAPPEGLTADDIKEEALRQRRDGIITPEQAQQAIDNADAVAQQNSGNAPESSTPIPALEATQPTDTQEPPPLSETKPEDVVAKAEELTKEAAPETQNDANEKSAETAKTPEQQAEALEQRRNELLGKLARENPKLNLGSKEVNDFLKLAAESETNMVTMEAMMEQYFGDQAKEAAEITGDDAIEEGTEAIGDKITRLEDQLAKLKKSVEGGDATKQDALEKKSWVLKLLKALAAVMGNTLVSAGVGMTAAGQALAGKENK